MIGGVDTHADTHQAAVLDQRGRLLGTAEFATSIGGYQQLLHWLRGHGSMQAVGVEGSGSYGAGPTRHLQAAGIGVVEVNRPHAHMRARHGNNDAIDAEAAARKVLAGECTTVPKHTTGTVQAIRQLHLARASAVQARATASAIMLNTRSKVSAPRRIRFRLGINHQDQKRHQNHSQLPAQASR